MEIGCVCVCAGERDGDKEEMREIGSGRVEG